MSAHFVECDQCGLLAVVRVDTEVTTEARRSQGKIPTQIVDCPSCGIHEQPAQIATSELTSTDSLPDVAGASQSCR
jgi:hypothetical protein